MSLSPRVGTGSGSSLGPSGSGEKAEGGCAGGGRGVLSENIWKGSKAIGKKGGV